MVGSCASQSGMLSQEHCNLMMRSGAFIVITEVKASVILKDVSFYVHLMNICFFW